MQEKHVRPSTKRPGLGVSILERTDPDPNSQVTHRSPYPLSNDPKRVGTF